MNRTSIIKKYEKPLGISSSVLGIVASILSFIGIIPPGIRGNLFFKILVILMLFIGAVLMFKFLRDFLKSKSKILTFLRYCFVLIFLALNIIVIAFQPNSKSSSQPLAANTENISKQNIENASITTDTNGDIKLDSSNNNHLIIGHDNVVGVNGDVTYVTNKPSPRKVNRKDLQLILSSIPSKDMRVRVNYPANNEEALNFSNQIVDALFQLGFTNISKGDVDKSMGYFGSGRITIKKDNLPVPAIRLIINPQQ